MIIYFDIETIPDQSLNQENLDKLIEKYWERANFMAVFNKIFTICVWRFDKEWWKIVKNLEWNEEAQLKDFAKICKGNVLCWHNILWFDIPFVIKRMLKYGIDIPKELKFYGKKPWEINHIDTLNVWKCWSYNWWASLDLICNFLWITNPKDFWIDWSQVAQFYKDWKQKEILEYCIRDVEAVMKLHLRMKEFNMV